MKNQLCILILTIALFSTRRHHKQNRKESRRTFQFDSDKQLAVINNQIDKIDLNPNQQNQQLKNKSNKKQDEFITEIDQQIQERKRKRKNTKQRRFRTKHDKNNKQDKNAQKSDGKKLKKEDKGKGKGGDGNSYPVYYPNYKNDYYNVYSPVASGNILNTLQGNPYMNARNNPLLGMTPMSTGQFYRLKNKEKQ